MIRVASIVSSSRLRERHGTAHLRNHQLPLLPEGRVRPPLNRSVGMGGDEHHPALAGYHPVKVSVQLRQLILPGDEHRSLNLLWFFF